MIKEEISKENCGTERRVDRIHIVKKKSRKVETDGR